MIFFLGLVARMHRSLNVRFLRSRSKEATELLGAISLRKTVSEQKQTLERVEKELSNVVRYMNDREEVSQTAGAVSVIFLAVVSGGMLGYIFWR